MKVIVIVPSLENKGPVIVARDIALNNKNKDIEFIFVSLRKNSSESLIQFTNFKVFELNLGKIPLFSFKLKKLIKELKPDIIHCHCFYPTLLSGLYLKEYYHKIISTLHNNPLEDFSYEYGKVISFFMVKSMIFFQRKFYLNIAISNYIKNIHNELDLNNVKVIYNGIPSMERNFKIFHTKNQKINLITVSVLNKRKNLDFLIEVCEKLKNLKLEFILTIIGNGSERKSLEKLIKEKKLENEVIFLGKLSREEVYEELFKSDIFLFSSKSEGFGLVIVEALSCNLPVIAGNIPVMEEIIETNKNGIICNFDVNEYVDAILNIYKNLGNFKLNTKKYFNENFSAEAMSENYIKLYKKTQNNNK